MLTGTTVTANGFYAGNGRTSPSVKVQRTGLSHWNADLKQSQRVAAYLRTSSATSWPLLLAGTLTRPNCSRPIPRFWDQRVRQSVRDEAEALMGLGLPQDRDVETETTSLVAYMRNKRAHASLFATDKLSVMQFPAESAHCNFSNSVCQQLKLASNMHMGHPQETTAGACACRYNLVQFKHCPYRSINDTSQRRLVPTDRALVVWIH